MHQEFDRNSEASAQDIIESILPQSQIREQILKLLVESITRAHHVKDSSWGITIHRHAVRLNVGQMEVLNFGRRKGKVIFYVVIDDEALTEENREELKRGGVQLSDSGRYKCVASSNGVEVPIQSLSITLPVLREPHLRLVEKAAKTVLTRTTWWYTYSPGVVKYLRNFLGVEIGDPSYRQADSSGKEKRDEFTSLFREFTESYLNTPQGQQHITVYDKQRGTGRENFNSVVAMTERGEDVTEQVLLKLLPHGDTRGNRERGSWIHVAPAITKDIKSWYEGAELTKPEDWPLIAAAVLHFIRRCNDDPKQLSAACAEFSALPYSKGFQSGMLSPILSSLRPDDFLIINNKSRKVINYFTSADYSGKLTDYAAINEAGHELIEEMAEGISPSGVSEARHTDLFDVFSHWLVAVKKCNYSAGIRE